MTRIQRLLAITLLASSGTAAASAQPLTPETIRTALAAGTSRHLDIFTAACIASPGFGENMSAALTGGAQLTGAFDIRIAGPAGRIALRAAEARRLYRPIPTLDDLAPADLEPGLSVEAEPRAPTRTASGMEIAAPIQQVVLAPKRKPATPLQPTALDLEPVSWANLLGGTATSTRAIARFSAADSDTLPPGDLQVILVTAAGERRCTIRATDRRRLR